MRLAARTHGAPCHGAPPALMATRRWSSRPQRRKRADDSDGGERGSAATAAAAAASSGRGGGGGDEQQQHPPAAAPRPLISGPAPFQLPRWPLRPLDEHDDAAANPSSPAAASLAQQRLRAAFESARADAVTLGVPSSALPRPQEGASADELAAALAHVQDVMASFLSANI